MKIFLVAGKASSGKGEVARMIKEFYIYRKEESVITSYSKYIKSLTMELTDWDGTDSDKPRKFLQELGDKIRAKNPDFFVENMLKDISVYEDLVQNVIISDVRMPNEIEMIRDNYDNVYAIYVENQFAQSPLSLEEQMHITETALENYDDFDYTIANDNLTTLRDKVFKYLEGLE